MSFYSQSPNAVTTKLKDRKGDNVLCLITTPLRLGGLNIYGVNENNMFTKIDLLGLTWLQLPGYPDFYLDYLLFLFKDGKNVDKGEVFKGGSGKPRFSQFVPPKYKKNDKGCFCIIEGTGLVKVLFPWWPVKPGAPTNADLNGIPQDIKNRLKIFLDNGGTYKLRGDADIKGLDQPMVDYINKHEKTEVDMNETLYNNTLGKLEKRIKEYRCPNGGFKTSDELDAYLKWDKAVKAYLDGTDKLRIAFDAKFAPGAVPNGSQTILTPAKPFSEFNEMDFYDILHPIIE